MKKKNKKYIQEVIEWMGIYAFVAVSWQLVEIILYKKYTARLLDTIIACILVNVMHCYYKKWR